MDEETLRRMALEARLAQTHAYAPYSKFMVGAAILTMDGNIYSGCNVESASHDGTHAEEAALCAMVMAGQRTPIVVLAMGALEEHEPQLVMPCGKCRQQLYEFMSLSGHRIMVVTLMLSDGICDTKPLHHLLTEAFGPADIGVNLAKYRR